MFNFINTQAPVSHSSSVSYRVNLLPLGGFSFSIRKKILKLVIANKYLPQTTFFFYKTLVNFFEFLTGRRVYLKLNPFVENSLTYLDLSRCCLWYNRVLSFQKILGHRIFLHESIKIFYIAIKFRDPTFLSN